MDLQAELFAVTGAFNEAKLDYALCGGLAVALHGFPRMTKDLDFLIKRKDVAKAKEVVRKLGFMLEASPMTFGFGTAREARIHRVSKLIGEDPLMLDLIEVEPTWGDVWKGRKKLQMLGVNVKAVSRDGLIAMKRLSGRPQDLYDIDALERSAKDEPS